MCENPGGNSLVTDLTPALRQVSGVGVGVGRAGPAAFVSSLQSHSGSRTTV